jgi:hypothetical protein
MSVIERGKIKGKTIVFPRPLGLPEGTEVYVRVETVEEVEAAKDAAGGGFSELAFFGMWADRANMPDSATWVNEERATWQTRSDPQD